MKNKEEESGSFFIVHPVDCRHNMQYICALQDSFKKIVLINVEKRTLCRDWNAL